MRPVFSSYWFLPYIVHQQNLRGKEAAGIREEKLQAYIDKYAIMVAEDFSRYKPDLVFLGNIPIDVDENETSFDFVDFFSANAAFRKEWEHYAKTGTIDINRRIYFPKTALDKDHVVTYDIYRRK